MSPSGGMALAVVFYALLRHFMPMDSELVQVGLFCVGLLASDIYAAFKRR